MRGPRKRQQIDHEQFVKVYTCSNSAAEVAAELGIPINIVRHTAQNLRVRGVALKRFPRGARSTIDIDRLNALIAVIAEAQGNEV